MDGGIVFIFLTVWAGLSWGVAELAISRGRSGVGFFFLSFLVSPLLALIVVLVMNNLVEENAQESKRRHEETRREIDRKRDHEKQLESLRALTAAQVGHANSQVIETGSPHSVADELTKLAALLDKGILSPEEFKQQKKILLEPPYAHAGK